MTKTINALFLFRQRVVKQMKISKYMISSSTTMLSTKGKEGIINKFTSLVLLSMQLVSKESKRTFIKFYRTELTLTNTQCVKERYLTVHGHSSPPCDVTWSLFLDVIKFLLWYAQ